jgi:hypothetical protein
MDPTLEALGAVPESQIDDVSARLSALGAEPEAAGVDAQLAALGAKPESTPEPTAEQILAQQQALQAKKTTVERIAEAIPESVTAGLEAYGRAMIPVGYQLLERAVGVSREEQERRAAENPMAAALGTVGGIAGSIAVGTGAAGALGKLAPGALLAKEAGGAIRGAAQLAAPQAAATVLGKTATGAAAGAAEALVLGTLLEADESMLKDRPFAAETALHSAIIGGGLGGVLAGVPAGVAALGQTGAGRWMAKGLGKTQFNQIAQTLGLSEKDIEVARKQIGPEGLPSVVNDAVKYRLVSPFMSAEKTLDRSKTMLERSGKAIGAFAREADERLTQEIAPKVDDIMERISDNVVRDYSTNYLTKGVAEEIAGYASDLKKRYPAGMRLSDVHDLRTQLDDKLFGPYGQRIPADTDLGSAYFKVRRILTDEINSGLERAGLDPQAWRIPQRQYAVAARIAKYAQGQVDAAQKAQPTVSPLTSAAALGGYLLKGSTGAVLGVVTRKAPDALAKAGGWVAGALKNALEAGAPKAVVQDLQAFSDMTANQLMSRVPGPALDGAQTARFEYLRVLNAADQTRNAIRSVPNVEQPYIDALDDAYKLLSRSFSPNMSPSFAAQRIKQAEDLLTPFSRLAEKRARFQDPAAQVVRSARDTMRTSLAQSDAWGQAYRDAAAQRLIDAAAAITDPRRVAALQGLEEMTLGLQTRIASKADELMGLAGQTTKQLATQKTQQNQVKRGLNRYIPIFEIPEDKPPVIVGYKEVPSEE